MITTIVWAFDHISIMITYKGGTLTMSEVRPRARDLGITIGVLPSGPLNAITDVAGVRVGHCTVWEGASPGRRGAGPARTGVTDSESWSIPILVIVIT